MSEGIVALGGNLRTETLRAAYSQGVFPWPMRGMPLAWFCPEERGILEFDRLHIPRSLERLRKRSTLRFTIDEAFDKVIHHCAKITRKGQDGTWITKAMEGAYKQLHREGDAHSVEVWNEKTLVGGIYGVDAGGAFAGESMFHLVPGASKLALLFLVEHLRAKGLDWMDIQMVTPLMESLGGRLIPRDEFLRKLARTRKRGLRLF